MSIKSTLREVLSFSAYLLSVLLLAYLMVHFVAQRTEVIGESMTYTLSDGDNLLVDKISYRFHEPRRFDIVVFPYRNDRNILYVKRIIGLPGEKIRIDEEGNIFINDVLLMESYGREIISNPGRAIDTITLGDDEYFVMGDNRNNSQDSRFEDVGNIPRKDLIGRVWIRILPIRDIGPVE